MCQALLEDHERLKENRERKAREKTEKEAKRQAALQVGKQRRGESMCLQRILMVPFFRSSIVGPIRRPGYHLGLPDNPTLQPGIPCVYPNSSLPAGHER